VFLSIMHIFFKKIIFIPLGTNNKKTEYQNKRSRDRFDGGNLPERARVQPNRANLQPIRLRLRSSAFGYVRPPVAGPGVLHPIEERGTLGKN